VGRSPRGCEYSFILPLCRGSHVRVLTRGGGKGRSNSEREPRSHKTRSCEEGLERPELRHFLGHRVRGSYSNSRESRKPPRLYGVDAVSSELRWIAIPGRAPLMGGIVWKKSWFLTCRVWTLVLAMRWRAERRATLRVSRLDITREESHF